MNVYPYVDMTRKNASGQYATYIIVRTRSGRFFVNTNLTTCGRLVGMTFPRADKSWRQKSSILSSYLLSVQRICLEGEIASMSNAELKEKILREVFGVESKAKVRYLTDYIEDFAKTKRECTSSIYRVTAQKVRKYDGKASFETVDMEWIDKFRNRLLDDGLSVNGAGKELRNIRAVFNWARKKSLTSNYPFLDYSIIEEVKAPNNISVEDLRKLRDYPCEDWQKPYVDFFMLSFYLAGINPVDLLSLKKSSMKDGHITFVRQKTNKQGASKIKSITLPVVAEAQAIIDKYPSKEGWLLGFMDNRSDYRSFSRAAGDAISKIGKSRKVKDKVGKLRKIEYDPICPGITLYTVRYTFGSIAANDLDISERTIGMCLGHSWTKNVTSRYMSVDQRRIDEAIRKVVEYVGGE